MTVSKAAGLVFGICVEALMLFLLNLNVLANKRISHHGNLAWKNHRNNHSSYVRKCPLAWRPRASFLLCPPYFELLFGKAIYSKKDFYRHGDFSLLLAFSVLHTRYFEDNKLRVKKSSDSDYVYMSNWPASRQLGRSKSVWRRYLHSLGVKNNSDDF